MRELLEWGFSIIAGMGVIYFVHRALNASYATSAAGGFIAGALLFSVFPSLPGHAMVGYTMGILGGVVSSKCSDDRCAPLHPEKEEAEC